MSFYQQLIEQTQAEREYLLSAPLIQRCLKQQSFTLAEYQAFLTEAYHHVKHTVPLLMSVGALLPESKEWLREAVAEYIEEELGHQEWVLNDIAATGASPGCSGSAPSVAPATIRRPRRAENRLAAIRSDTTRTKAAPSAATAALAAVIAPTTTLARAATDIVKSRAKGSVTCPATVTISAMRPAASARPWLATAQASA